MNQVIQLKVKQWLNGFLKKTQLYGAYKGIISLLKTNRLRVKRWKKILHANGNQKRTGVFILR